MAVDADAGCFQPIFDPHRRTWFRASFTISGNSVSSGDCRYMLSHGRLEPFMALKYFFKDQFSKGRQ
jgi:hypothetical protein